MKNMFCMHNPHINHTWNFGSLNRDSKKIGKEGERNE